MTSKKIFWGLFAGIITISACDKITHPINEGVVNTSLPNTPPTFRDSSNSNYATTYKILLEDIMGHFCGNCPPASEEADSLTTYNNHVITIEDNSGFFADTAGEKGGPGVPPGLPAGAFSENLQSVIGNYWQSGKLYNFVSWPKGLIDRIHWSQSAPNNIGIDPGNWVTLIDSLIAANPQPSVTINIHDSCWVPQRKMGMQIDLSVPFALNGTYYLQALIVEDNCLGWQVDDYTNPKNLPTYNHRFVLRSAVGNDQGSNYAGGKIPASVTGSSGGKWTTWLTFDFNKGENGKANNWKMEDCYIVAYVYNAATNAIIQAEEIKVE